MRHDLVIEGRAINPWAVYNTVQIGIDGAFITAIKKQGLKGEKTLKTPDCLIFPGFVDIHAHLREDSSERWNYKEDFRSGTEAALHGGVTTVVDMPNTPLPAINARRLRAKKALARQKSRVDVFFYGLVTGTNLKEVADMGKEAIGYKIFLADSLRIRTEQLPEAVRAVGSRPLVVHCEDQALIDSRSSELRAAVDEEPHSWLRPAQAELVAINRVLACCASSRTINIAHVSVYDSLTLIKGGGVHCEVTPHHLFFTRDDLKRRKGLLKTNPPLRTELDRRLLLYAFRSGNIDFLVTDHAPHTKEEKALDILEAPAGVPNLDTFGNFVSWLIFNQGVHPSVIAMTCAYNPAKFLLLSDRGSIEEGKRANLTILEHRTVKIKAEQLRTKCGWSPFEGYEFPGAVRYTILNGKVHISQ